MDDQSCRLCGNATGTLLHRRCCPATAAQLASPEPPPHLRASWAVLTDAQRNLLITRGMLAEYDLTRYTVSPTEVFYWHVRPPDAVICSDWIVYLDGSLRDSPSLRTSRGGWAFVALNSEGLVVAAAYGVPPPWVRTIHGAELWACFAALRCSLPGAAYRPDRLAVVLTFRRGRQFATRPSVALARLWRLVYTECDDYDCPERDIDLQWIPAHTAADDVGVLQLSSGAFLTAADRQGNMMADDLAKRGAALHRLPEAVLEAHKRHTQLASWAACELAIRTVVSNNFTSADGATGLRDSDGLPRWRRSTARMPAQRGPRAKWPLLPTAQVLRCTGATPSESSGPSSDSGSSVVVRHQRAATRRRGAQAAQRARSESLCLRASLLRRHQLAAPSDGTAQQRLQALRARVRTKEHAAAV